MDNIDRLISEQVHSWARREAKARQNIGTVEKWPSITISRQYGALGRSLAKKLGKRMGFNVWDKKLLSAIAEEAGADEKFMASLDERRRKMINDVLVGTLMGSKHSNTHYFRSLLKVVHTIGEHGKSIIVGRGSNYILKSSKVLRLRIVGPLDQRIEYIAKKEGVSKSEARKLIETREEERNDFIQYYFKKDIENPNEYDLVLNSGSFSLDEMVDLTILAYEKKAGKSIHQPVRL